MMDSFWTRTSPSFILEMHYSFRGGAVFPLRFITVTFENLCWKLVRVIDTVLRNLNIFQNVFLGFGRLNPNVFKANFEA